MHCLVEEGNQKGPSGKTSPKMTNGCVYCFQGTVRETLVFQRLHANNSPPLVNQMPFSAGEEQGPGETWGWGRIRGLPPGERELMALFN